MKRAILLVAAVLLASFLVRAQANSSQSAASPSAVRNNDSLPRDTHEGLTVSADSYADVARAKEKFGKANPVAVGILPVEVFLRNDTTEAVRIDMSSVQLTVRFSNGGLQNLDWLDVKDVASAVAHPNGPPAPRARRFPIGVPSATDSKTEKTAEILKPLALDADVIPPLGMIHGFLFFDLNREMNLAEKASLYIPNLTRIPANKPLMFFEVRLSGNAAQ